MSHRSLGRQEQYSMSEMEEESIFEEQTKKGRIARKHTPIKNNKVRPQYARIYDEDLISDDEEPEQFIAVKPIR